MRRLFAMLVCVGILASGCVKKSEYEAATRKIADLSGQLDASKQEAISLQDALDRERQNVADLQEQIDHHKAAIAELKKQLGDAEEQNAQLKQENEKLKADLAQTVSDKAKLKKSAEELMKAVKELEARKAEAEKRVKEFKKLLAKFKKLIDAGKLQVRIRDGRMVLVLPTDILFASGSAELSEEGEVAVSEVAQVLTTIKDREFQVEGHTDNVPIANKKRFKDNWELAAARAMVVVRTMMEAGMNGKRLSAASYGEFRPVASNDTPEGRAKNRRIDIVVVPDLSKLPGFAELQEAVSEK